MVNIIQGNVLVPREFYFNNPWYLLAVTDIKTFWATYDELTRQKNGLEMIASENMPSEAVLAALSSVANNKYAEGYPGQGKRYYGGCEFVDISERLAIERAKVLFGAKHANVQPHAGTQANQAAFYALMNPGDKILSMDLSHGGHLSHGAAFNATGNIYQIVHYGVNEGGFIDYDQVRDLALSERPKVIVAGGSAYPRTIFFDKFRQIADESGAYLVADIAHIAGLIAAGLHPSPIDCAHITTTTTHKTLRGPRGGMILLGNDYDMQVPSKIGNRPLQDLHKVVDSSVFPGMQGGPLEHVIAAKAVAFKEALNEEESGVNPEFRRYQQQTLANTSILAGFFLDKGYTLSSNGTDNHLILVINPRGLTGKCAQYATEYIGITTNKNIIPYDLQTPFVTSGLRLGTPALTTRGITEDATLEIAYSLDALFSSISENQNHTPNVSNDIIKRLRPKIDEICKDYPLYEGLDNVFEFIIQDLRLQRPK